MITLAISNQKGGVGKTTIAFNLAQILANRQRHKVLAIDNDPQGNLTSSFLENSEMMGSGVLDAYKGNSLIPHQVSKDLDLLGSSIDLAPIAEKDFQVVFRLKEAFALLRSASASLSYDYVIIDCLPAFGHLQLAALTAADFVLVPVKLAPYALAGIKDLFDTIDKVKRFMNPGLEVLGIVINQVDGRDLVLEREMEEVLRSEYGKLVFKNKLSKRVCVEESPTFYQSIVDYKPDSSSSKEFLALVREMLNRIKRKKIIKDNNAVGKR